MASIVIATSRLEKRREFIQVLEENTTPIPGSISDGVVTVDRLWRIDAFNRAAEAISGISGKEPVGLRCADPDKIPEILEVDRPP